MRPRMERVVSTLRLIRLALGGAIVSVAIANVYGRYAGYTGMEHEGIAAGTGFIAVLGLKLVHFI